MSVAQKLCDEIVEPALKPSTTDLTQDANTSTHHKPVRSISNSYCKQNGRVTKSIFEKKKVIKKLDPYDKTIINQHRSKEIIRKKLADTAVNTFVTGPLRCDNQHRSKEIIRKKLADTAVNTLVTGPLRCDNDCVTLVRKRDKDNHGSCKCSNKHSSKISTKQIQTFATKDYSFAEKACAAQRVETVSCGTQFMTKSGMLAQSSNRNRPNLSNSNQPYHNASIKLDRSTPALHRVDNSPPLGYMGARRWALTKYPARGPDF